MNTNTSTLELVREIGVSLLHKAVHIIEAAPEFTDEQVLELAQRDFSSEQLDSITHCIRVYNLTFEQVSVIVNPDLTPEQMESLAYSFSGYRLSIEQVSSIANPDFSPEQMSYLLELLWHEWPSELIAVIANPALSTTQMSRLRHWSRYMSIEQVKECANPEFTVAQMVEELKKRRELNNSLPT